MQPPASQPEQKNLPDATVSSPPPSPPPFFDATQGRSDYDPEHADSVVRLPALLFNEHFWRLGWSLLCFLVASFVTTVFHKKEESEVDRKQARARAFKELLFKLGPTYIKLGQFLSVRRDILPLELAEELALLQDKVPPFDLQLARQTISNDLGKRPEDLFLEFQDIPLASASIGQVHRVTLKDGTQAVIKVQRPGLAYAFYRDLGLMRMVARWWLACEQFIEKLGLNKQAPHSVRGTGGQANNIARQRPLDVQTWVQLSDEFGRTLFSEIDYIKEGRNADRLRKLVRPNPQIRVPRVFWKHTGRHVLTLEYIPGTKISHIDEILARGLDPKEVGNMLVNCYLEQFVLTGFFHADPHAGNLAVDNDGRLIIYDFGMMGEVSEQHRRALLSCVMAVVRRDSEQVTRSLMELGIVSRSAPAESVARAITPFIDYYSGRDIMDLDFHNLEADIDHVISERSFRLPANLAYLLRAGSSLEGVARTLKPDFSFVAAVKPVMMKWALQQGFDALAKNGRLIEFAQFTIKEIRASRAAAHEAKSLNDNGFKLQTGHKGSNGAQLPVVSAPAAKSEVVKHDKDRAHFKAVIATTQKRARQAQILALAYIVIVAGITIFLANVASFHYRQLCIYLVIGNSILGAIIFWKFSELLKWNLQSLSEVEKKRGDGDS